MEILFSKTTIPCLRQVKNEIQSLEETQELRMPEEYPDIGKILGTWGQVLLRGKEWRDDCMMVSGGVMTWILYRAEGESGELRTVEAWIPFQMKWDLPPTQHDGTIRVIPLLRSVDARTTSARKMVARVTVALLGEAFVQDEVQISTLPELPEDMNVLQQSYLLQLPREAGEKSFDMEEELSLPSSCPKIGQVIRFSLQPELIDQKVLSGKLVFRGTAIVHILYQSADGELNTWDFEVPFSRYAELDDLYEQEATSSINLAVTSLELQEAADGTLCLKAGMTGQYIIYDRALATIGQDAYSNYRDVQIHHDDVYLPAVLEMRQRTITAESGSQADGRIIDAAFYPDQPQIQRNNDEVMVVLSGQFHLLAEKDQQLVGAVHKCSATLSMTTEKDVKTTVVAIPSGKPDTSGKLSADILVETLCVTTQGIPMIISLDAGVLCEENTEKPSLILRKAGRDSLWKIAKDCGSTVDAICKTNQLDGEVDPLSVLLIPIQ